MGVIQEHPAAASQLESTDFDPPASQVPPDRDVYHRPASEQELNSQERRGCRAAFRKMACAPSTVWQKVMCALFWTVISAIAIMLFVVIFPRFVDKVVSPFIRLLRSRLTPSQIAGIIFAAVVFVPMIIIIGIVPFVWLAGMVFNFWVALAIVMAASTVGMSLQYWMARYFFHDRVVRRLEKDQKSGMAVVLRSVEYMGQWKVVALLRLGPAPYNILSYALGVCPSVKYFPMIICSVICELLPRGLQVFFGRSLETLADLLRGRSTNVGVAVYNVAVLLIGVVFIVVTVILSKRMLRKVEAQEKAREAAAAQAAEAAEAAETGLVQPSPEGQTAGLSSFTGKVEGKLAACKAAAALDQTVAGVDGSGRRPGSTSSSGIEVLVDESATPGQQLSADDRTNSSSSFRIGTEQQQPLAAVSRSNTELSSAPSLGSRMSSSSSLRWLLGGDRSSSSKA